MKNWLFLSIAIVTEVIATSALKASNGISKLWPSLVVVVGYGLSFYFMALALHSIRVGVAYAVWSGVGIILITLIARVAYDQRLDLPAFIGMALIILGVIVMNLFSKVVAR
ncbi:MAG: multidrug efflux SMR transporter [Anaerolineales bacterium]|nr:multidrug efflux SMR transporter [Anaerolineales bacterium]